MAAHPLSLGAIHRLHVGFRSLYLRVARKHHVNASYVSKIVSGERRSAEIEQALSDEVNRLLRTKIVRAVSVNVLEDHSRRRK